MGKGFRKYWICCIMVVMAGLFCAGCGILRQEHIKLEDLEFTVLGEEMIPEELGELIAEKKQEPFRFTYSDKTFLYICIGYGEQETGGYSIAVEELYLTDQGVCVSTRLLGPDAEEKSNRTPSYPYIVIKTAYQDTSVIFE